MTLPGVEPVGCPSTRQLEQWLQQAPGAPDLEARAAHVDECPLCQQVLEQLTAKGRPLPPSPVLTSTVVGPARVSDQKPELFAPAPANSSPPLQQETRALLQRRLRVVCPV